MASANVIIGGQPAARVSDQCICMAVGIPDPISTGSATVHINELMAARMGDMTGHGGMVASGCFTVLIGDSTTSGSGGAGQGTSAAGAAEPPSRL